MLPGFLLVLLLAWTYTFVGAAALLPLFAGVAPAVTALIVRALDRIGRHTLTDRFLWVIAAASVILTLLDVHFLLVFIVAAVSQALWARGLTPGAIAALALLSAGAIGVALIFPDGQQTISAGGNLFIDGLKGGLLSFGGAYTAIPFLKESMVGAYPGITPQSFLDSIALSNVVPAPLVIFGTFLGFLADGLWGAVLVTLGIFIPAFSFTLVGHRYLEKAIENPSLHGALDGVAAAVVGLLAITAVHIALQTLTGIPSVLIFAAALTGLYQVRKKWAVPAIIIGCGLFGLLLHV